MHPKKLILFLVVVLFGLFAEAKSEDETLLHEDVAVVLPSAEELKKLTLSEEELYWLALQNLMEELSQNDESQGAKFATSSWWMNSAFAATGGQCAYAGYIAQRDANNLCSSKNLPKCNGSASRIMCNPVVYGPDVCVSPGNRATANCTKSARSVAKIKEYREKNLQAYEKLKADFASYCRKGKQVSVCMMVRSRLGEAARVVAESKIPRQPSARGPQASIQSSSYVPNMAAEAARTNRSAARLQAEDKAALAKNGGCMSEYLVQGVRCEGNAKTLLDPHEAYAIFCDGNKEALAARKSDLLNRISEFKSCTKRLMANYKGNRSQRYLYERYKSQLLNIEAGAAQFAKCAAVVAKGRRIEPAGGSRYGSLNYYVPGWPLSVQFSGNKQKGVVDRLNSLQNFKLFGYQGLGSRFCDFNLVPKAGSGSNPPPASGKSQDSSR